MGGIIQLFRRKSRGFQKLGHCPLFDLYSQPWTPVAPVGVSWSSLMCYNERVLGIKV